MCEIEKNMLHVKHPQTFVFRCILLLRCLPDLLLTFTHFIKPTPGEGLGSERVHMFRKRRIFRPGKSYQIYKRDIWYMVYLHLKLLQKSKKDTSSPLKTCQALTKKNIFDQKKMAPLAIFCHGWWPSFASPSHFGILFGSPDRAWKHRWCWIWFFLLNPCQKKSVPPCSPCVAHGKINHLGDFFLHIFANQPNL